MQKKSYLVIIFLIGILVTLHLNGHSLNSLVAMGENIFIKMQIFNLILQELQQSYVEEVNPVELIEDAIKGMLSNLDPHTTYLSREQFEIWQQKFNGFIGFGIHYNYIRGNLIITSVIENSPAEQAGIWANDQIIAIDAEKVSGLKQIEIEQKLTGKAGDTINLTIQRNGTVLSHNFTLKREQISLNSVNQAFMITEDIGYIQLSKFTALTREEMVTALQKLEQRGFKKLVLDLRQNGGGLMQAAIDVVDLFLPGKRKILYKKGRSKDSFEVYYSTGQTQFIQLPLIVLIDHASASSSEIVAGAIQDWDRGLIIGEPSFGKGLVQSQIRFADNSALLMTTAKYYTPCGRLIQRDYQTKTKEQYYHEAYNDSIRDSLSRQHELPQFKTIQGRTIFGGGGIHPDVIVKLKYPEVSPELRNLYYYSKTRVPVINIFVEDYIRNNKLGFSVSDKNDVKALNRFINTFALDSELFDHLKKIINEVQFPIKDLSHEENKADLEFLLMREIASRIWGEYGHFKVKLTRDDQLLQALAHFPQTEQLLETSLTMYRHHQDFAPY